MSAACKFYGSDAVAYTFDPDNAYSWVCVNG